jgi:hypothetical protein
VSRLPDDPKSGDGTEARMLLTCRECPWRINMRPIVATAGAVRHTEETGHSVSYKGVIQQFSRVERTDQ